MFVVTEHNPLVKHYTMATSGNANEIKIWNITSYISPKHETSAHNIEIVLVTTFDGHCSAVTCVRYNSAGTYLISSSMDKLIKIWDQNAACVVTLDGHTRYVNCVAFSRDSTLAVSGALNRKLQIVGVIIAKGFSGSNDKSVLVWDLTGAVTLDSVLAQSLVVQNGGHAALNNSGDVQEHNVVRYAETNDNDVHLLEKLDDIADGAINSCCFCGTNVLATAGG